MMPQLSLEKNYLLLIKIEFCDKKWICVKNRNFERKNAFFIKFQKSMKNGQKKCNFFKKKIRTLFCFKVTSNCRKLISKLLLESPEPILCDHKALNAPKLYLTLLARLKVKNLIFSAKISRLFDFQISKLARLKTVTKTKALTCAMRSYDPKQASLMISSHSHEFGALNGIFLLPQIFIFQS